MTGPLPAWLAEEPVAGWATRTVPMPSVRLELSLPATWPEPGTAADLPTHREAFAEGTTPGEGLLAQCMETADPSADLRGWAQAAVHLTGVPAVVLALRAVGDLELLEWRDLGPQAGQATARRLEVDEAALFEGLVAAPLGLSRVWVVLARRERTAWQIGLALESALVPGAPEAFVDAQDHARAAVVLGPLRLG